MSRQEVIVYSWMERMDLLYTAEGKDQLAISVGGLWRSEVSGCNHPGGRNCASYFLHAVNIHIQTRRRPCHSHGSEASGSLTQLYNKYNNSVEVVRVQLYNKYSLRTSSAPYGLAASCSGCHDFPAVTLPSKLWPKLSLSSLGLLLSDIWL